MKKKALSLFLITSLVTASFTTGVIASDKITAVTAYVNKSLAIKVNGEKIEPKESDGSRIYPIVYNERTYVPARAVAEALGASVGYDDSGDGTITITSNSNLGKPTKDAEPTNVTPSTRTNTNTNINTNNNSETDSSSASQNSGTFSSPINMNETYTYDFIYKSSYGDPESYSSTNSITVKDVKVITDAELNKLGFKRNSSNSNYSVDYALVKVKFEAKDAKLIQGDKDYPPYLDSVAPSYMTTEAISGDVKIDGNAGYYGFDESYKEQVEDAADLRQLTSEADSFSCEGYVIVPLIANAKNYLRVENFTGSDTTYIYFKQY